MEDDIKRLGELLRGNEALSAAMADLVARSTDVDLEYFYEEIDRSNYSLEDWASALVAFDRWIEGQGKVEGGRVRWRVSCTSAWESPWAASVACQSPWWWRRRWGARSWPPTARAAC